MTSAKIQIFEQFAELARVLGNAHRLELMEHVRRANAGAVNIPSKTWKGGLPTSPKGQEIVAYCRGRYCIMSFEAVASLRAKGYRIRRLEDGFPEWKAAGLDVEFAA